MAPSHFVSASCRGEHCTMCNAPATHKVGEELFSDDPFQYPRHNMTAYICCQHFGQIMHTTCQPKAAQSDAPSNNPPSRLVGESEE